MSNHARDLTFAAAPQPEDDTDDDDSSEESDVDGAPTMRGGDMRGGGRSRGTDDFQRAVTFAASAGASWRVFATDCGLVTPGADVWAKLGLNNM